MIIRGPGDKDDALDAINGLEKVGFPRWTQNIVVTITAAFIMAISFGGWHLRDVVRDNVSAIAILKNNQTERFAAIDEFHKWPRFTHEDAKTLIRPIEKEVTEIAAEEEELEKRMDEQEKRLFQLPYTLHYPFTDQWQNRILENKDNILKCGCTTGDK